ncbi:MAG: substrate-binding domain-containing protein [Thermaerobacter sp.]|nr:substrate-binding domain-containing protein [Thermaerobacter sp.]
MLLGLALVIGAPTGTGARPAGIRVMGATSLVPFLIATASRWHVAHPTSPEVHVAAGGSLAGIYQLERGTVDAAASDIPPSAVLGRAAAGWGALVLGRLPVVLVVHPGVGVTRVSRQNLAGLLTGRVRSWQELGGAAENVVVVTRGLGSGSLWVMQHQVLGGTPLTDRAVVQWSNGAVLKTVAATPGAIGFVDSGFVRRSVVVLGLGGAMYQPRDPARWPLFATAGLYWRQRGTPALTAFVQFAARQPDRTRFGIVGEEATPHEERSPRARGAPVGRDGRPRGLDGWPDGLAGGGHS